MINLDAFIRGLPKAELHMHLEGSIEPELMFDLAARNGMELRWKSVADLRAAYQFDDLSSFLDLYFEGCRVLITRRDFYDITRAYLHRAQQDGVIRAEIFFGPQSFTERGVTIETMMDGILDAIDDGAREHGMSVGLLISTHRHRSESDALALLDEIMPWSDRIAGIGMGGPEVGNPPSRFVNYFRTARERGFHTTVHAGEEGPPAYIREAIELLEVERIDHGVTCVRDPELVRELARRQIPLTVCPLSNLRLKGVATLAEHPLKAMIAAGLNVTINSDDPPYFDGWVSENMIACQHALALSRDEIVDLARNSIRAAFVSATEITRMTARLDAYVAAFGPA
jgi:adenosine deaminase